ncbi:lipopolysaccharide biosynthesis protein [Microbacterium pseudoresistens]|uniref:lipopolysaccharide biosynthesis protein n=1 Tax=Microbacterium pseudoresistens TaxID=640634 RepID=UPI0031ECB34B
MDDGAHEPVKQRIGGAGRGFASVLSGTVIAQLIAFAVLPVISRLYDPDAFGAFSFVLAVTAVIAPVATLRLETAAMLPRRASAVRAVVMNCLICIAASTVLTAVVVELLQLWGLTALQDIPFASLWIAVLVLFTALYSLLSQLALRRKLYGSVARRNVYQAASAGASQLALALVTRQGTGLIAGQALGRVAGLIPLWLQTRDDFRMVDRRVRRVAWRTYWRFPAVFTPSALLNAIGAQAPLLFVTMWFGLEAGGQIGMAERIVGIPLALIGAAAAQVIEAEVSQKVRDGSGGLRPTYLRVSGLLAVVGLVVGVGFGVLGGWVIPMILGADWAVAGIAVQILALNSAVRLVGSPLSKFILIYQRSLANTVLDVLRVALMGAAFTVTAVINLDLTTSLWWIYTALAITYVVTWCYGLLLAASGDTNR